MKIIDATPGQAAWRFKCPKCHVPKLIESPIVEGSAMAARPDIGATIVCDTCGAQLRIDHVYSGTVEVSVWDPDPMRRLEMPPL